MQNYSKILSETQIFPPIIYFIYVQHFDIILIEAKEHYQKRSYRNRFVIGTSSGPRELSIPLRSGKNNKQLIQQVQIDYHHSWESKILQAIRSSYGKAPYFIYYFDEIADIIQHHSGNLFELNLKSLQFALKQISWKGNLQYTSDYLSKYEATDVLDLRNYFYNLQSNAVVLPSYNQVFVFHKEFQSNLSILDLLFHLGPESFYYLKDNSSSFSKIL